MGCVMFSFLFFSFLLFVIILCYELSVLAGTAMFEGLWLLGGLLYLYCLTTLEDIDC
jgi:hypothetical protein